MAYDRKNTDTFGYDGDPFNYVEWDDGSGNHRPMFDAELSQELAEQYGWDNDYDGGFVYKGDESEFEGLTIREGYSGIIE